MAYLHATRRRRGRTDLFLFLGLLAVGGLVSVLSAAQQGALASAVRSSVLYPFLELHRASAERTRLQRRAAALQAERDSLVGALSRYRALADQAADLRGVFGLPAPAVGGVLPAEVLPGRPRIGDSNVFVLRGLPADTLLVPAGVFTGRGLVGVVRERHAAGAWGQFWTHPDFRVSVETADGTVSGIIRSLERDGGQPVMLLEGAPFQEELAPGTRLVTTGIAGVHPPGIHVGVVRDQAEGEAGWMKRYVVDPAVRPEEADVVLVWRRPDLGS